MSNQNVQAQVVRGPLQDASVQYRNREFVADQIFPIVPVISTQAKIWVYDKGAHLRDEAGIRAAGTKARRGGLTGSWVNIDPKEYAWASEVTDEDRENSELQLAPPLEPDTDAVEFCASKIDLKKERLISALILGATWVDGNGAGGEDAAGLWAAADATNTLLADVQKAFRSIAGKIGAVGNLKKCMMMDQVGLDGVIEAVAKSSVHAYSQGGRPTAEWLANYLGLDRLIVGASVYDSGAEKKAGGQNTVVNIWQVNANKGLAFCYVRPEAIGLKMVAPGLQARLKYNDQNGGGERRVTSWREYAEHQDVYEVAERTQFLQLCADAGYMFKDIVAD